MARHCPVWSDMIEASPTQPRSGLIPKCANVHYADTDWHAVHPRTSVYDLPNMRRDVPSPRQCEDKGMALMPRSITSIQSRSVTSAGTTLTKPCLKTWDHQQSAADRQNK